MKNIYYVGHKQSDCEASFHNQTMDGYFAGSITRHGNNKRGNIAHNASTGIQMSKAPKYTERNSKVLTQFINEKCRIIMAKDPDAWFYPYDPVFGSFIPQELQDRVVCRNDLSVYKILDSKFKFREIFKDLLPIIPHEYMSGKDIIKKIKSGEFPNKREVVVQLEYGSAGYGTYVVNKRYFADKTIKEATLAELDPKTTYLVSKHIDSIGEAGIHILVSNNEVHVLPPSIVLYKGHHKLAGVAFEPFFKLPKEMQEKTYEAGRIFGEFVQNHPELKMRGWVHIEMIYGKDGNCYAIEANPRIGGDIGLYNRMFRQSGLRSAFEYAHDAFYNETTDFTKSLERLVPKGLWRHANIETDKDGNIQSLEAEHIGQEGFDMAIIREEEIYVHSVYEPTTNI